jgi:signal transduction histidine kinase
MIVFAVGFVALIAFAWRLASRVRRLQNEADDAIDAHGRIRGNITGTEIQDEIGALSRALNGTLQRLKRYNDYLEKMAARLSHELRTPVAVVRSSLDNLRVGEISEKDRVYIDRADEGVQRLSSLIARMSEASQLEGMLSNADKSVFDLAIVVGGCVEGYRLAYARQIFQFDIDGSAPILIDGNADAIAQMLDKLTQNAVDFATPGTAIRITLGGRGGSVFLTVENEGPPLPLNAASHLFVSMVSSRSEGIAHGGHLGLGLYIVRLIAEFHGGLVDARNRHPGNGVCFSIALPRHMRSDASAKT